MSNQILVPILGESITEATVSKWLKHVGDNVNADEPIAELETDKVNLEIPSPCSGTLSSIECKEGSTVEVGSLLGLVEEGKPNLSKPIETESKKEKNQEPEQKNENFEKINIIKKIRRKKKIQNFLK